MPKQLAALVLVVASLTFGVNEGRAAPVEYVRVCSAYGTGYFYVPGTEVCFNPLTGITKQQTEGGTWISSAPNAPAQYASNPAAACLGGTVVPLGTLDNGDFARNSYMRMEASLAGLSLGQGEFVSSFLLSGQLTRVNAAHGTLRFTGIDGTVIPRDTAVLRDGDVRYVTLNEATVGDGGVPGETQVGAVAVIGGASGVMAPGTTLTLAAATSGVDAQVTAIDGFDSATVRSFSSANMCLSYRDALGTYVPLGCEDVTQLKHTPATLAFVPRHSVAPPDLIAPVALTANLPDLLYASVEGELTVAACVRAASADGAVCSVTPTAGGVTVNCGASSATIANGTQGPAGGSCTVTDRGNGTATMTCPDGSSVAVSTSASAAIKDDGCNGAPGANALLVGLAMVGQALRSRRRK